MNCPYCTSSKTSQLAEMFLNRGFEFTHEAVRDWEARFAPLITQQLSAKRRGKAGKSWYCDETYLKVGGKWHYLYRAIDRDGNLVDSMLSEHRDMASAKRFFTQAKEVVGQKPLRVTTDGHDSYPRAIRRILGRKVIHGTSRYLNNRLEQDHRGIKQRYYPIRGFGSRKLTRRYQSRPTWAAMNNKMAYLFTTLRDLLGQGKYG